jgi:hypothetical protein
LLERVSVASLAGGTGFVGVLRPGWFLPRIWFALIIIHPPVRMGADPAGISPSLPSGMFVQ